MTHLLHDLTACQLSAAYRTRELSPVEVTRAVLARIDRWEQRLNAMFLIDAEGALVHDVDDGLHLIEAVQAGRVRNVAR